MKYKVILEESDEGFAVSVPGLPGFSLDATVRIEARDRKGLERLLRYCARPIFASERLAWAPTGKRVVYSLPKPLPDGQTVLSLTPMELLERLARLIPPPRRHRHRFIMVSWPPMPRCALR
jgi:Putative transposase.